MKRNRIIPIIGLVIAAAVLLFGQGILRKSFERKQIFCGIEQSELRIPSPLVDEMKTISTHWDKVYIYNIFVKNDSRSVCMNPIITIKLNGTILGYVVNETNEDKIEVEKSISIADERDLILRPIRLGTNSFIDLTVWTNFPVTLYEGTVSFSSDSDYELKTGFISFRSGEEKFK